MEMSTRYSFDDGLDKIMKNLNLNYINMPSDEWL